MRSTAWCLGLLAVALVACTPTALPPSSASARQVLDAYLGALRAGDCATARALATGSMTSSNGDLCGQVHVSATRVEGEPAGGPGELTFMTMLTISGADQSMHDGDNTWFYSLKQQADGAWRLVGGGSGP